MNPRDPRADRDQFGQLSSSKGDPGGVNITCSSSRRAPPNLSRVVVIFRTALGVQKRLQTGEERADDAEPGGRQA